MSSRASLKTIGSEWFMLGMLLLLLGVSAAPAAAGAWDAINWVSAADFSQPSSDPAFPSSEGSGLLDATTWTPLEIVREIRSGKLVSKLRVAAAAGTQNNDLIAYPGVIQSLQTDARIVATTGPAGALARLRLMGSFYNSGLGAGQTGDIQAMIQVHNDAANGILYRVIKCTNTDCSSNTQQFNSGPIIASPTPGTAYTLGIAWDGSQFTFTIYPTGGAVQTYIYNPKPAAPVTKSTPNVSMAVLGSQVAVPASSLAGALASVYGGNS